MRDRMIVVPTLMLAFVTAAVLPATPAIAEPIR